MKWKLRRGQFRPQLQKLIESNDEAVVADATAESGEIARGLSADSPDAEAYIEAIEALSERLKGVGPATASLVLSVQHEALPFMSDEFLAYLDLPLKYTTQNLSEFLKRSTALLRKLREADDTWTMARLEVAVWSKNQTERRQNQKAKKQKPDEKPEKSSLAVAKKR